MPSVTGIIVYRGLYFGMYDSIKPVLLVGPLEGNFLASFLLGWTVTTGAGIASYPLDTIRRRMMMTSGEVSLTTISTRKMSSKTNALCYRPSSTSHPSMQPDRSSPRREPSRSSRVPVPTSSVVSPAPACSRSTTKSNCSCSARSSSELKHTNHHNQRVKHGAWGRISHLACRLDCKTERACKCGSGSGR